jgi:hypothetical protein
MVIPVFDMLNELLTCHGTTAGLMIKEGFVISIEKPGI